MKRLLSIMIIFFCFGIAFAETEQDILVNKIKKIRPNSEWTLRGNKYEGLEWLDKKQKKPTLQEINETVLPVEKQSVTEKDNLEIKRIELKIEELELRIKELEKQNVK